MLYGAGRGLQMVGKAAGPVVGFNKAATPNNMKLIPTNKSANAKAKIPADPAKATQSQVKPITFSQKSKSLGQSSNTLRAENAANRMMFPEGSIFQTTKTSSANAKIATTAVDGYTENAVSFLGERKSLVAGVGSESESLFIFNYSTPRSLDMLSLPKQQKAAPKLTKGQIVRYLQNIEQVSLEQLTIDLKKLGFRFLYANHEEKIYKFSHVIKKLRNNKKVPANLKSAKVIVEIHCDCPSGPHMHIKDSHGNLYDKNLVNLTDIVRTKNPTWHENKLKEVVKRLPESHINIKEFVEVTMRPENA